MDHRDKRFSHRAYKFLRPDALIPYLAKAKVPRIVMVSACRGSLTEISGAKPGRTGGLAFNSSKAALSMSAS